MTVLGAGCRHDMLQLLHIEMPNCEISVLSEFHSASGPEVGTESYNIYQTHILLVY
jgi:hypothetical protein